MVREISNNELKRKLIERLKSLIEKYDTLKKEESARNFGGGPENLTYVKGLGGTTGAKLYKDSDGNLYVWKEGGGKNKEGHIRNEQTADDFYRASGINVPDGKIFDTPKGPVKLTRYIEDGESLDKWWAKATPTQRKEMKAKLQKGYAADILLGNWDVVGATGDNILVDKDENPWRIDNGGAMGYRAQGEKKTQEEWNDGFPDDLWTMTGRGDKIGSKKTTNITDYFGNTDLLETINDIDGKDWSKALDSLDPKNRAVVEKRLEAIKVLAERGNDFDSTGYVRSYTENILDHSYVLTKDGLIDSIPDKISERSGNFGIFRNNNIHNTKPSDVPSGYEDKHDIITKAAKNINYHKQNGDTNYNQTKLQDCYALIPELEKKVKSGDKHAQYYLDLVNKIKDAEQNNTDAPTVKGPLTPKQNVQNISFQQKIEEYINQAPPPGVTPPHYNMIERWAGGQARNSYLEEYAARFKCLQLKAMGIDITDLNKYPSVDDVLQKARENGYYVGDRNINYKTKEQENAIINAIAYYRKNTTEFERHCETHARYQAAVQVALENTNFYGKDGKTRTIILLRTENPDIRDKNGVRLGDKKPGELSNHLPGVAESHSQIKTVIVDGDTLTMVRVPFSRINGFYWTDRNSSGRSMFLGDDENEINADTHGLDIFIIKQHVKNRRDANLFIKRFEDAEKKHNSSKTQTV